MIHVSNEDNLIPLKKACESCRSGIIRIASGWIRSSHLRQVITEPVMKRIRKGDIALRVLIRVGSPDDVSITDPGVIAFLNSLAEAEKSDVQWRYSAHHHAKMYITGEEWAMLGSFNLTGGGFGTPESSGSNPEAGVILDDPGQIRGAIERFESMWQTARELNQSLAGFVANQSANDVFTIIGVRPLPAGMFVQIKGEDEGRIILAKVERSLRYHSDFFSVPEGGEGLDPLMFKAFAGRYLNQNQINGVAWSGEKELYQLHIAEARPVNLIVPDGERLRFEPNNLPPKVAVAVHRADPDLLKSFFNPAASGYAVLEENPDVAVSFDDHEILSKHFAVLGSTGSGKSYFVKKYLAGRLNQVAAETATRIVIVDTHGEYAAGDMTVKAKEIMDRKAADKARAVFIEDREDVKDILGGNALSKEEKQILAEAFAAAGAAATGKEQAFADAIRNSGGTMDWSNVLAELEIVANSGEKWTGQPIIQAVANYITETDSLGKIGDKAIRKELLARKKREIIRELKSKFKEVDVPARLTAFADQMDRGDYRLEGLNLIKALEKPGVYRLDLSGIDDTDIRRAVCGDLMREVFERAKAEMGEDSNFRTLFVVDEAQNYAPEKAGRDMPSFKWMKVIASEGRKFNVALLVMTQRPAYLSKDILTQCNTQAIFRLVNQADISQVEQSVEGISEYDLLQLPNFVAGQAIFTGVGMKMPVRVRVKE